MKQIKEYHGELNPGDELYEKLKEENADYIRNCERDKYCRHHIVYLQQREDTQIVCYSASPHEPEMKLPFADCLERIDGRDFHQVLMLLTLFPWHTEAELLNKLLAPQKGPLSFLDRMLTHTRGWILYRQQFEMIVQIAMGVPAAEAMKIRKDYNAGKNEAYALLEGYTLWGESLSYIFRNRCITRIVHEPAFRIQGAVLLHTYLTERLEFTL